MRTFTTKSGVVFKGQVETETAKAITLNVGQGERSIVTLARENVVAIDGVAVVRKRKRRPVQVPLVLTSDATYSNQPLTGVLLFSSEVASVEREALSRAVPAPLQFFTSWVTPRMFVAATDTFFSLDVRISYNRKARALFEGGEIERFSEDRFDVLSDAGIDDEPSGSELRAFGKDLAGFVTLAHSTAKLSVAYVSFVAGLGAIERLAKAHPDEARETAVTSLASLWAQGAPSGDSRIVFENMTHEVLLLAVARERAFMGEDERAAIGALIASIERSIAVDDTWRSLFSKFS